MLLTSKPDHGSSIGGVYKPSGLVRRSNLFGYAGYGYSPAHSRFYWGCELMLIATAEGTVTAFGLANPKLEGEREQVLSMMDTPANKPPTGTVIVCDKGFAGADFEAAMIDEYAQVIIRPARRGERDRACSPPGCGNAPKRSSGR